MGPRRVPLAPSDDGGDQHPQQKAPNVRHHGDSAGTATTENVHARQELPEEPLTQYKYCGDGKKKDEDQREDARPRIKKDVGPHYAGDRTAGAESRNV